MKRHSATAAKAGRALATAGQEKYKGTHTLDSSGGGHCFLERASSKQANEKRSPPPGFQQDLDLQRQLSSTRLSDRLQGKLQTHRGFTRWQNDGETLCFALAVQRLMQPQDIISEVLQDGSSPLLLLKDKRCGLIQTQLKSTEEMPMAAAFPRLFKGIKFQSLGISFTYHKLCLQFCPLQQFPEPMGIRTGYCKISKAGSF